MAARRLFFNMFGTMVAVVFGLLSTRGVSARTTYSVRWALPFRMDGLKQEGIPPSLHATTIEAGDSIKFEYDPSRDDLLEVHSNGFIDRNSLPIRTWTDGNTTITFSSPGIFYYTCSHLHHHLAGQFIMVIVRKDTSPPERSSEAPSESPLAGRNVDEAAQPDSSLTVDYTSMTDEANTTLKTHTATEDLKPAPQTSPTNSKQVKPAEQKEVKNDHAQSPATTQRAAGHSDSKEKQEVRSSNSSRQHSANHPFSSTHDNDRGKPTTTAQHNGEKQAKPEGRAHGGPWAGHTNGTNGPRAKSSAAVHRRPTSGNTTGADSGLQAEPMVAVHGGPTAGNTTSGDGPHRPKSTAAVDGGPTAGHTGGNEPFEKSAATANGRPTEGHTAGGDGPHANSSIAVHGTPASGHTTGGDELQAKASVDQTNTSDGDRQANGSAVANAN